LPVWNIIDVNEAPEGYDWHLFQWDLSKTAKIYQIDDNDPTLITNLG